VDFFFRDCFVFGFLAPAGAERFALFLFALATRIHPDKEELYAPFFALQFF
jgi:hypothetical protein